MRQTGSHAATSAAYFISSITLSAQVDQLATIETELRVDYGRMSVQMVTKC
jgi:hypothetical protein